MKYKIGATEMGGQQKKEKERMENEREGDREGHRKYKKIDTVLDIGQSRQCTA